MYPDIYVPNPKGWDIYLKTPNVDGASCFGGEEKDICVLLRKVVINMEYVSNIISYSKSIEAEKKDKEELLKQIDFNVNKVYEMLYTTDNQFLHPYTATFNGSGSVLYGELFSLCYTMKKQAYDYHYLFYKQEHKITAITNAVCRRLSNFFENFIVAL